MSKIQIILMIFRIFNAIEAKDSAIVENVVIPAIVDELADDSSTDAEKAEVGGLFSDLLKGLFGV